MRRSLGLAPALRLQGFPEFGCLWKVGSQALVQRLPVLAEGHLVGMLSRHDVLRAVKEFAQHEKGKTND